MSDGDQWMNRVIDSRLLFEPEAKREHKWGYAVKDALNDPRNVGYISLCARTMAITPVSEFCITHFRVMLRGEMARGLLKAGLPIGKRVMTAATFSHIEEKVTIPVSSMLTGYVVNCEMIDIIRNDVPDIALEIDIFHPTMDHLHAVQKKIEFIETQAGGWKRRNVKAYADETDRTNPYQAVVPVKNPNPEFLPSHQLSALRQAGIEVLFDAKGALKKRRRRAIEI